MTNTPNSTEIITPASEAVIERRPSRKLWWIAGGGIALAVALGAAALGVSIADASEDDDRDDQTSQVSAPVAPTNGSDDRTTNSSGDDAPISADDRGKAEAAAIAEVGEGTITDVDRSDDADHAWEVEVTFSDGRDADVELNSNFEVVKVDHDI